MAWQAAGVRSRRLAIGTLPNRIASLLRIGCPQKGVVKKTAHTKNSTEDIAMSVGTILLIIVILMLVGAFPSWPHSKSWGYGPSGGLGLVLVIILVLLLMGRI